LGRVNKAGKALNRGTVSMKERISPFISLRHTDFRRMWFGQLISEAGSEMQMVAINWHVYILTHSPIALGLVSLARVVPHLILSLVGGVYADSHDRRKILMVTQSTMMLLAGLLALFHDAGNLSVALIYVISGGLAAALAFDGPAWSSMVPNLVPREHLMNALSLNNVMRNAATVAGPALAGFIIAWKGVVAVYVINIVSFIAVLIALIRMKTPTQASLVVSKVSLSAIREGIHFVFKSQILLATTMVDFFSTFLSSATALLPIFVKEILNVGPQGLGILYSARSIGAVTAAVGMSFLGNVRKKGRLVLYSVSIYALATAIFGGSHWFALSCLALMMVGAGDTVSTIMRQNIRQVETPDHLRGRMQSVIRLFTIGGPQLGNLEAGILATFIGAPWSVITGGIANLLFIGAAAKKFPKLKNFES